MRLADRRQASQTRTSVPVLGDSLRCSEDHYRSHLLPSSRFRQWSQESRSSVGVAAIPSLCAVRLSVAAPVVDAVPVPDSAYIVSGLTEFVAPVTAVCTAPVPDAGTSHHVCGDRGVSASRVRSTCGNGIARCPNVGSVCDVIVTSAVGAARVLVEGTLQRLRCLWRPHVTLASVVVLQCAGLQPFPCCRCR